MNCSVVDKEGSMRLAKQRDGLRISWMQMNDSPDMQNGKGIWEFRLEGGKGTNN